MVNNDFILECIEISKRFPGVLALDNVNFNCRRGEIHGLLGENGAGKSTLMKIVAGAYTKDRGEILLEGKKLNIKNTRDALQKKIITVFQEGSVIEDQTVVENIFLNHEIKISKTPFLDNKTMKKKSNDLINDYGLKIKSGQQVKFLSVDEKKMVEVFRALTQGVKLLILDEPTSSLTDQETIKLLNFLKELKKQNIGIIFITHNINEALNICDRVTILREGKKVNTVITKNTDHKEIVSLMLGRYVSEKISKNNTYIKDDKILEVKGLNVKRKLHDINFHLKRGEILGVTGLIGSGSTYLAETLFGSNSIKKDTGDFFLNGKEIIVNKPSTAIKNGIGYLTPDRKGEGLFLRFPIYDNISIVSLKKFINKFGLISKKKQIATTEKYIKIIDIKTPSVKTFVESLSGGNQQKVVISKWLEISPDILILNEPTVGIDVGAKIEIRKIIIDMTSKGKSIILISTEADDLVGLCDRIVIMYKGRIIKEIDGTIATKELIVKEATKGYEKEIIND